MIGDTVAGRYRIIQQVGEGGMGVVYEARHIGTERRVAVKVITGNAAEDSERLARFHVEAKAAGVIESDHITQVFDLDTDEASGLPFMAMEYLEGEDLQALIKRLGKLPADAACRIIAQACHGLAKAHDADVLHRDIKPANIYLAKRDGELRLVKLLDFGIAKIHRDLDSTGEDAQQEGGITTTGTLIGSPLYMSPEQTKSLKKVDRSTDVWSLGICFYEAVCGFSPFQDAEGIGGIILAINSEPVRTRDKAPWVPGPVAAIIDRALRIKRSKRWPRVHDMLAAIEQLLPEGTDLQEDMLVGDPSTEPWVDPDARSSARVGVLDASTELANLEETLPADTELGDDLVAALPPEEAPAPGAVAQPLSAGAAEVAAAGTHEPVMSTPQPSLPPAEAKRGGTMWLVLAAAVVLVVGGVGFAAATGLFSSSDQPSAAGAETTQAAPPGTPAETASPEPESTATAEVSASGSATSSASADVSATASSPPAVTSPPATTTKPATPTAPTSEPTAPSTYDPNREL